MFEQLFQDVRFGWRWLARSPGFTVVAAASLAIGIGFNTALFGIVDAFLLRPLPVAAPDELVTIYTSGRDGDAYSSSSYRDYLDLRHGNEVFTDLAGHSLMLAAVNLTDRSRLAMGELVTGNYFSLLGVAPIVGRALRPDDDRPDAERVAMIAHRTWQRDYGGDPSVVGRTLRIRGLSYTIVGVAPASFTGMLSALGAELWLPVSQVDEVEPGGMIDTVPSPTGTTRLERRGQRWMFMKGRLKPGVSVAQAQANVAVLGAQLQAAYPQTNADRTLTVLPATSGRLLHPAADRLALTIGGGLMALLGLVLLIACANVASMLLARAASRQREIGVRVAVGASGGRIVRQLLTESVLLGLVGAAAGSLLAWALLRILSVTPLPLPIPVVFAVRYDARIALFTTLVSSIAGIVAGLAPAFRARRPDVVSALRGAEARQALAGRRWTVRDLLVAGQMAMTMLLLVVAGLLGRSLLASSQAPVGFGTKGIAVVSTDPRMLRLDDAQARQFFERAVDRIRALPGVDAVATASRAPFSLNFTNGQFDIPGLATPDDRGFTILSAEVSADYFSLLGVPLLQGRTFATSDTRESPRVAIISDAMARRYWPGQDAVGKRFHQKDHAGDIEIVGVASDYRVRTVGEEPQAYIHFADSQASEIGPTILARTSGDEDQLLAAMRQALVALEPNITLLDNQTMRTQLSSTLLPIRASALVAVGAGAVALVLAAVGLYGLVAYSVARRTREIGIRIALGADRASVLALVVRQGLLLAGAGLGGGAIVAGLAARVVSGYLYGVSLGDPVAWSAAAGVLGAMTFAANLVPAYRASRVDPTTALRIE
ncbi:MAG: ABC transporter permease [Vicinamibacterales bacterium]